jgi:NAD(P) transhydrogenase subunit beta
VTDALLRATLLAQDSTRVQLDDPWLNLAYLVAATLFILGLKGLAHPRTAVRGNFLGALGMLIAVAATLLGVEGIQGLYVVLAGLVVGSAIGIVLAQKVQMTAMPQMVALLNGLGGGASVLVAGAELINVGGTPAMDVSIAIAASG